MRFLQFFRSKNMYLTLSLLAIFGIAAIVSGTTVPKSWVGRKPVAFASGTTVPKSWVGRKPTV